MSASIRGGIALGGAVCARSLNARDLLRAFLGVVLLDQPCVNRLRVALHLLRAVSHVYQRASPPEASAPIRAADLIFSFFTTDTKKTHYFRVAALAFFISRLYSMENQ